MRRPARWSSAVGVLLVEAVLSSVVIATGLAFITRGLSNQLRALRTFEEYDRLSSLAHAELLELEQRMLLRQLPSQAKDVPFDAPYAHYHWTVTVTTLPQPEGQEAAMPMCEVALALRRVDGASSQVNVSSLWPDDQRIPNEWR